MIKAAAAIAAFGACAVASAQGDRLDTTPSGLSVRAGIAISMDSSLTNSLGSSLIGLGIEYRFSTNLIKSGETYLAIDYMTKNFGGARGSILPITVNQRWFSMKPGRTLRTYGFLGLGIAIVDIIDSGTTLCFRGGLGMELGGSTFAEIALTVAEARNGIKPNTVGIYFGYRF